MLLGCVFFSFSFSWGGGGVYELSCAIYGHWNLWAIGVHAGTVCWIGLDFVHVCGFVCGVV